MPTLVTMQAENKKDARRLKIALLERGLTITDLARSLGRPRSSVSQAIHHPARLPRLAAAIRRKIGL